MMTDPVFYYRVPGRANGYRPGAHAGTATGAGHDFKAHARLLDYPDPRRLDLRASLRAGRDEWLVRTYRQRASVPVYAAVDVSASMEVGMPRKLDVAAQFVAAMGNSAFKAGDPAGLCAFDSAAREDLYLPARHSRGGGQVMAAMVSRPPVAAGAANRNSCGLVAAVRPLAGRHALVFLVSDFHWPLQELAAALDVLDRACVVPLVIWDASEISPPEAGGFVHLRDAEQGRVRPVWINDRLREKWRASVARRRQELDTLFAGRHLNPVYLTGAFHADVLSRYFLESFS